MRNSLTVTLFSLTMFISAALMFSVQPMIGKMLLPHVGGAPAGWIVAMAFFQAMLLAGYFLAHALSRFDARKQALLYLVCLGIGLLVLPVSMAHSGDETLNGFEVFTLLLTSVALPFVALSATSSTIQRLFTVTGHKQAQDPYFLYAASNLGSLLGLAAYPLMIEPYYGLLLQSRTWLYVYVALILTSVICLSLTKPLQNDAHATDHSEPETPKTPVPAKTKWLWLLLAFFPSSLLLGVTTHITTAIFSAPMLWSLPLALYLFTFVVAFSKKPLVSLNTMARIQPFAVTAILGSMIVLQPSPLTVSWYAVFGHALIFTVIALTCHLRLADSRPKQDTRHLTVFYLMISIGGALGGVFNAFIAPFIFKTAFEYPLMLLLALTVNPFFSAAHSTRIRVFLWIAGICLVLIMLSLSGVVFNYMSQHQMLLAFSLILTVVILSSCHPKPAFLCGMALIAINYALPVKVVAQERNFYGIVKVVDNKTRINEKDYATRTIQHGTTNHGMQVLDPAYERMPISYYVQDGPIGDVFRAQNPQRALVVGLGAGVMNCLAKPETEMTFIEIDPAIVNIAQRDFTYLSGCPHKSPPRIITGDGRLVMKKIDGRFDVIMLDAFTSDAIPLHLVTMEAMAAYLDKLSAGGLLVFHISNRYFDLGPVLARTAEAIGIKNRFIAFAPEEISEIALPSIWIAFARNDADFARLDALEKNWVPIKPPAKQTVWTDDWNYLLGTLRSHNLKAMGLTE